METITIAEVVPFELQKISLRNWWHYEYAKWLYEAIRIISKNEWWEESEEFYIKKIFTRK